MHGPAHPKTPSLPARIRPGNIVEYVASALYPPGNHADEQNEKYSGRDLDDHVKKPLQKAGIFALRMPGFEKFSFLKCEAARRDGI